MRKDYDIILLGLFRWDGPYSSISIAMAKEFARHNRVFYINHPFTYRDYFTVLKGEENTSLRKELNSKKNIYKSDQNVGENFLSITPPLTYPINFLPKGKIYNFLKQKNQKIIDESVSQLIEDKQIEKYIFINCFDPFYSPAFPQSAKPELVIYQCVDDIAQSEYTVRHGLYLENEAIHDSDLTLVTSTELYRLKSNLTSSIHILNNAADIGNFEKALLDEYSRPKGLKNINSPIIGYVGNLDELRVDYDLIKQVAIDHKDKNLVFIGPINNKKYKKIGLDEMENVHFLGKKSIDELPPYLKYFDCCIIPFQCNTLTKSIYPLKINEYLAAGKPVVATNFSEDISSFIDHIYLSKTVGDFSENISKALAEDCQELIADRHSIAKKNSWTHRIDEFWQIANKYIPQQMVEGERKS